MTQLLADKARYKTSVIESLDVLFKQIKQNQPRATRKKHQQEIDQLNALPQVQEMLAATMRTYYQEWPHQKIPLLNNKTPKQAIKTRDGKEMVEALLVQMERKPPGDIDPNLHKSMLAELRATLGLKHEA